MKNTKILIILIIICLILVGCSKKETSNETISDNMVNKPKLRILSLAPNITSMICAMGHRNDLVGVTRFCVYPDMNTDKISNVGGYLDFSLEEAMRTNPNIVFLSENHTSAKEAFENTDVKVCIVGITTFEDIPKTITAIGNAIGEPLKAEELVKTFNGSCTKIREKTNHMYEKPKVLICLGRDYGTDQMGRIYIAGNTSIYEGALEVCNAKNVFADKGIENPALTLEGIMELNPDVIIEITPNYDELSVSREQIIKDWNVAPKINAVKNKRVYVLSDREASIPDQDFYKVVDKLADLIHKSEKKNWFDIEYIK